MNETRGPEPAQRFVIAQIVCRAHDAGCWGDASRVGFIQFLHPDKNVFQLLRVNFFFTGLELKSRQLGYMVDCVLVNFHNVPSSRFFDLIPKLTYFRSQIEA